MPTAAPTPSGKRDRGQTSAWIKLASMFVGQSLDKGAVIGAYIAAAATFAISILILLITHLVTRH
jgi:hypothetical protein